MSRGLSLLMGAAIIGVAPTTFAAVTESAVWQLGDDDARTSPFRSESYSPNLAPGSATAKDDDYYFAGNYPPPVGELAADENPINVERALTSGDPRNRIHFPLSPAERSDTSRLRLTVDLFSGGGWIGTSLPGFQSHEVAVRFNGRLLDTRSGIIRDTTLTFTIAASSVGATAADNVIEIERTGGSEGGYIQLDHIKLEADPDGLADLDHDGLPLWFEETYLLDDSDAADAAGDRDDDGLTALEEFAAGTNPTDPDSDNDGLLDGEESSTDPLLADTDGDGLSDSRESTSDPLLTDSDADTFPDNLELEHGSDPRSAASTPFSFAGAVGLQFTSERAGSEPLAAGDPAGYFRFPHWNASPPLPGWAPDDTALGGSMANLVNSRGQVTPISASWTFRTAAAGVHQGLSDERLLSGMISAANSSSGKVPATLTLSGIPYPKYDLLVYVGNNYPTHRGVLTLDGLDGSRRYFVSDSSPPFLAWREITAGSEAEIAPGNLVRYRNLSGPGRTLQLDQLDNDQVAIHGIQIIDTSTDADLDGMADSEEIEHGLDPRVADAASDLDSDGLGNAAELAAGTDPRLPDTDSDGLPDGAEAGHGADPLDPDSDDDTLADGDEIDALPFPSLPNDADSDNDSFSDAAERLAGSDPMNAASRPPPVPGWDAASRTWRWRIDDLRLRWNHSQAMLGAISGSNTMLFEAIAELDDGGWQNQIAIGIYYDKGVITHRFRCINGVFHRAGNPASALYNTGSTSPANDRRRAFGFSGYGEADDSHPLRLEFTATRPNPLANEWDITFSLLDVSDLHSPETIATYNWTGAPAADARLLDGSAPWTDDLGNPGVIRFQTRPGIDAFLTRSALGPIDTDSDGMPDDWETAHGLSPADPEDAGLDADGDSLSNLREFLAGSDPRLADTDGDGASDAAEIAQGTSPGSSSSKPAWSAFAGSLDDLDGDGMSDAWTLWSGGIARHPSADDDGDGTSNLEESEAGTDPDDPSSRFEMTARRSGDDLVLDWTDLPSKIHRVETSGFLGEWNLATGLPPASAAGGRRSMTLAGALTHPESSRFYRAGVAPLDSDLDGVEDWIESHVLFSSPTEADSMGSPLALSESTSLSGDARALLDRVRGTSPEGGVSGVDPAGSPSPVNAARFLMQATFGPVPADIEAVRRQGYDAWIDEQLALPPSLLQPYIKQIKADANGPRIDRTYDYNEGSGFVTGENITTPWARHAVGAADQLRQRVAFALSEILVVSHRDAQLEQKPEALTHYYDTLIKHAFGNYGELLTEVSLHPAMGWYLSSVGNRKADPSIPRYPDENFAREIMQLFSIGLWRLEPDGTRSLDGSGEPIPTYGNDEITELARVFTGLYYDAPYGWGGGGWADEHFTKPMVMYPAYHDFEAKTLLDGFVIPAREATAGNGIRDVRDAVDSLFRHPNTPPFISKRLIQFLVTDNPSPAYVRRIQDVFVDDGSGTRGNLGAVVKAILLDPEARGIPLDENFGKVREPVIRTMHLGRLFKLAETHPGFVWWNSESNYAAYSFQEPLDSPSVFNFFTPEYQAPGEIRDRGLVSPAFQILDSYSSISFPNLLWEYLQIGFKSSWNGPRYPLDFSSSLLVADDSALLIDQLDLLVCAGNMTARTRSILKSTLADPQLTPHDRLAVALWTTLTSPEGATQR